MEQDSPDIPVFPPLAFGLALIGAILLGLWLPIGLLPDFLRWPGVLVGAFIMVVAISIAVSGVRAFRRAGTNVNPHQPALTIVQDGAFRYTRNAMYLGMVLLVLGYGITALTLWGVIAAVILWGVLHFGVVRPEERYLSAKFAEDYQALLKATPCWL